MRTKTYKLFLLIAGALLAAVAAFCIGFSIKTGMKHTIFTACMYGALAFVCFATRREIIKKEETSNE